MEGASVNTTPMNGKLDSRFRKRINTETGIPSFILPEPNGQFTANHCILTSDSWSLQLASCLLLFIPSTKAGNRRAPHTTITDTHQSQDTGMGTQQAKGSGPTVGVTVKSMFHSHQQPLPYSLWVRTEEQASFSFPANGQFQENTGLMNDTPDKPSCSDAVMYCVLVIYQKACLALLHPFQEDESHQSVGAPGCFRCGAVWKKFQGSDLRSRKEGQFCLPSREPGHSA